MANNVSPDDLTKKFTDFLGERFATLSPEKVREMFGLIFGKAFDKALKSGGIKQTNTPQTTKKIEESKQEKKTTSEKKQDVAPQDLKTTVAPKEVEKISVENKEEKTTTPVVVKQDVAPKETKQTVPLPISPSQPKQETESKLQKREVTPVVELGPPTIKEIKKLLPSSLSDVLKNLDKKVGSLGDSLKGLGSAAGKGFGLGALGVLGVLFAVFSFISSIQDSGPFKGLKMLIGKLSLAGAELALQGFVKSMVFLKDRVFGIFNIFKSAGPEALSKIDDVAKATSKGKIAELVERMVAPLKNFFGTIWKPISNFFGGIFAGIKNSILGFFGKSGGAAVAVEGVGKVATTGGKGFIGTFLAGLGKTIRFLPFIGGIFSIYSAWNRFKSGDLIGGGIDVISAICDFVTPLFPPLKFVSLGLTAINALLDFKAGGSDVAGGKAKPKGEMIFGWLKNIGKWIVEKLLLIPGVKDIVKGWNLILEGKYLEGWSEFPIIGGFIRAFMNPVKELASGNVIAVAIMGPVRLLVDVISGFINMVTNGIKAIIRKLPDWLVPDQIENWAKEEKPQQQTKSTNKQKDKKELEKPVQKPNDGMIDPKGGLVISSPEKGNLFQINKDDGVALGPYYEKSKNQPNINFDNKALQSVAQNTKSTNEGIMQLASGFMALAKQLGVFADKAGSNKTNVVNNVVAPPQQTETTAEAVRRIGVTPITQFRNTLNQQYV